MRRLPALLLLLCLPPLALLPPGAALAEPPVYQVGGIALGGTDVVSYFEEKGPERGSAAFVSTYQGATWHFASAANRDRFAADPAAFAPQYGGWCAFAAAKGAKAPTVPEAWTLVDGRLYLNYSTQVMRAWRSDPPGFIAAADAAWPDLRER